MFVGKYFCLFKDSKTTVYMQFLNDLEIVSLREDVFSLFDRLIQYILNNLSLLHPNTNPSFLKRPCANPCTMHI